MKKSRFIIILIAVIFVISFLTPILDLPLADLLNWGILSAGLVSLVCLFYGRVGAEMGEYQGFGTVTL